MKCNTYGGDHNNNENNIVVCWENFLSAIMTNDGAPPDRMQREIGTFMNNREMRSNDDDSHSANNGHNANLEELGDFQHDDSWMGAAHNNENTCVNEKDLGNIADAHARWNANHDFTQLSQTCAAPLNIEDIDNKHKIIIDPERIVSRIEINKNTLNKMQRAAHDLIAWATKLHAGASHADRGDDVSRLQLLIGKGGTGKTHVLGSAITTLKRENDHSDDNFLIMAPAGKAASNTCRSALHSNKEGLSMPVRKKCAPLEGERLKHYQAKFKHLKIVVIDEHTMIGQKALHQIDCRLKEIAGSTKPFGGLVVVVFDDPGKLPPASMSTMWIDICQEDDLLGFNLRKQFNDVIKLTENKRLDPQDEDALIFDEFLDRLRDGKNTDNDWNTLREKCSHCSMGGEG